MVAARSSLNPAKEVKALSDQCLERGEERPPQPHVAETRKAAIPIFFGSRNSSISPVQLLVLLIERRSPGEQTIDANEHRFVKLRPSLYSLSKMRYSGQNLKMKIFLERLQRRKHACIIQANDLDT